MPTTEERRDYIARMHKKLLSEHWNETRTLRLQEQLLRSVGKFTSHSKASLEKAKLTRFHGFWACHCLGKPLYPRYVKKCQTG